MDIRSKTEAPLSGNSMQLAGIWLIVSAVLYMMSFSIYYLYHTMKVDILALGRYGYDIEVFDCIKAILLIAAGICCILVKKKGRLFYMLLLLVYCLDIWMWGGQDLILKNCLLYAIFVCAFAYVVGFFRILNFSWYAALFAEMYFTSVWLRYLLISEYPISFMRTLTFGFYRITFVMSIAMICSATCSKRYKLDLKKLIGIVVEEDDQEKIQ